jgi:hypothetical protein
MDVLSTEEGPYVENVRTECSLEKYGEVVFAFYNCPF